MSLLTRSILCTQEIDKQTRKLVQEYVSKNKNKKNKKEEKHTLNLKLKHGLIPDNQREKTQWKKNASGQDVHPLLPACR